MIYENPTVALYTNVIQDTSNTVIGTLEGIKSYRQSYQANLGYYACMITIADVPDSLLLDIFYSTLGCHLKAKTGSLTAWEGMVYDMTLHYGDVSRNRSFDGMSNSVKVTYADTNGDVHTSSAATQANSIATYGTKEELIVMDSFDQTPAEKRRDLALMKTAWPYTQAIGTNFESDHMLEIMAFGYGWTLNWRYTTTADDSTSDVGSWIADIVDTDAEYVSKGKVASNTLAVKQQLSSPSRCWDIIETLTELGDSSGNIYQSYVDDNRKFYYRQLDTTANYLIQNGKIKTRGGTDIIDPWSVRPAVFRDVDYFSAPAEPGSYFSDARDFYVEEVEVGTGGMITLKTALFDEVELLANQQEFLNRQANTPRSGRTPSGHEPERLNWKRKVGLTQEEWKKWEKMSPGERWKYRKEKLAEWKAKKKKKG